PGAAQAPGGCAGDRHRGETPPPRRGDGRPEPEGGRGGGGPHPPPARVRHHERGRRGAHHADRDVARLAGGGAGPGEEDRRGAAGRGGARSKGGGGLPRLEVHGGDEAMSEPLLKLDNVVAFYGDFQALFGVSFEVRPREVLALLGGNGAGKT